MNSDIESWPLYKVQEAAVGDQPSGASRELARRYAQTVVWGGHQGKQRERVAQAYLKGWGGETNPWDRGRGGNFARPLDRAWYAGKRERQQLENLVRGERRVMQAGHYEGKWDRSTDRRQPFDYAILKTWTTRKDWPQLSGPGPVENLVNLTKEVADAH